jgi:hypothetical protein
LLIRAFPCGIRTLKVKNYIWSFPFLKLKLFSFLLPLRSLV